MKRKLWCGLMAVVVSAMTAMGQTVIATDEAGNYWVGDAVQSGANQGSGFGRWTPDAIYSFKTVVPPAFKYSMFSNMASANDGSVFVLDSEGAGTNVTTTWKRPFETPMKIGDTFSIQMGQYWDRGERGINLWAGTTWLMNVKHFGGNTVQYSFGTDTVVSTQWREDAIMTISVLQLADQKLELTITRDYRTALGGAIQTETLANQVVSGALAGVPDTLEVFAGQHADVPNAANYALYFNNLQITQMDGGRLTLSGPDRALLTDETATFTLSRLGDVGDEVTLSSSDSAVASVPATVTFDASASIATFSVTLLADGVATISAASGNVDADSVSITVVDLDQYDAYDDATYYPEGWGDPANGGFGFDVWQLSTGPGEAQGVGYTNHTGRFIGNSTENGGGNVNIGGSAFGIYANQSSTEEAVDAPAPEYNATRSFGYTVGVGGSISYELGVCHRNGAKGATLQNNGTWLFEVSVQNDQYGYQIHGDESSFVPIDAWEITEVGGLDTAIQVVLERTTETTYDITLTRVTAAFGEKVETLTDVELVASPNEVRFYVYNTEVGGANNLYFNKLAFVKGEGAVPSDFISIGGGAYYVTNLNEVLTFTATASSANVGPDATVTSSDETVLAVSDASITFVGNEATFDVTAVGNGMATLTVSDGNISGTYNVTVKDLTIYSAYDDAGDAAYDSGLVSAVNGGFGFEPWTILLTPAESTEVIHSGTFIGDATVASLNTDGRAFGVYANYSLPEAPVPNPEVKAQRKLPAALAVGQSMSIELGFEWTGGAKGVKFQGTYGSATYDRIEVYTSGDYNYKLDGNDENIMPLGWEWKGAFVARVKVTCVAENTFDLSILRLGHPEDTVSVSGIVLPGGIDQIEIYNYGSADGNPAQNLYFNRLCVEGEGGTTAQTYAEWMNQFSALTGNDALETADPDEDGLTNMEEFILDTHPGVFNDLTGFAFTGITADGKVSVVKDGDSARKYTFEFATGLNDDKDGFGFGNSAVVTSSSSEFSVPIPAALEGAMVIYAITNVSP